jgi:hypothetical protein
MKNHVIETPNSAETQTTCSSTNSAATPETQVVPMVPETQATPIAPETQVASTTNDAEPTAPDPFSVEALRLDQNFIEKTGVRKLVTTVPVRKPKKQEWLMVHSDPAYRGIFAVIKLEEDGDYYIVAPAIASQLINETLKVTIYTAINKQGVVFLWPARLPDPDARVNTWHTSAIEAAEMAMKRSVRVKANTALGAYEIIDRDDPIPENDPVWPDLTFAELLSIGFRKVGRFVDSFDHPVIKKLRGLC